MYAGKGVPLSQRVIGCAHQVSIALGAGFLESVYENALAIELAAAGLNFQRQHPLPVRYRGQLIGTFVADFVIEGKLIVELKALSKLQPEHDAQVMNYLRATGLRVGLLLNFGTPKLGIKRIVWDYREEDRI